MDIEKSPFPWFLDDDEIKDAENELVADVGFANFIQLLERNSSSRR